MYLTVHTTIGIIIGEQIHNPFASFVLGATTHFVLDMIPHGDYVRLGLGEEKVVRTFMMKLIASLDALLMVGSLWLLAPPHLITLPVATAVLGSVAPDYLWGFHELTRWRVLRPYRKFHSWFHPHPDKDIPFWFGTLYQLLFVIFVILSLT
ncbi:MAG: hypothetical protein AB1352_01870 [Patescibacteria group bacterium]